MAAALLPALWLLAGIGPLEDVTVTTRSIDVPAGVLEASQDVTDNPVGPFAVGEVFRPVLPAGRRIGQEWRRVNGINIDANVHLVAVAKGAVGLRDIGKIEKRLLRPAGPRSRTA